MADGESCATSSQPPRSACRQTCVVAPSVGASPLPPEVHAISESGRFGVQESFTASVDSTSYLSAVVEFRNTRTDGKSVHPPRS